MARTYTIKSFREVFYSVSKPVGGPEVGGDPVDVMLIQYLLNRRDHSHDKKPYGGQRPLAIDGVMGAQTHYRLLNFLVRAYGGETSSSDPDKTTSFIKPIPDLPAGVSPDVVVRRSAMALLVLQAFFTGDRPSVHHVTMPDMPDMLAHALAKNVTDL